jgi:hypothetical protein
MLLLSRKNYFENFVFVYPFFIFTGSTTCLILTEILSTDLGVMSIALIPGKKKNLKDMLSPRG